MDSRRLVASIFFIIFIIVFIPMPIPEHQEAHENVGYPTGSDAWNFVAEKEVQDPKGNTYPKYGMDDGYMNVNSYIGTLSYLEGSFIVPKRGDVLSYDTRYNNHKISSIILYDSEGNSHILHPSFKYSIGTPYQYDISPFAGQKVTVRMYQSSDMGYIHWYYRNIRVTNKPYTIWDTLNLFKNTLIYAFLLSILVGFLIGASGLEFFNECIYKTEVFIHKNKTEALGFENEYIISFLKMSFKALDFSIHAVDNLHNKKITNGIKVTLILFLSFTIIYTTKFLIYVIVVIIITLLILAVILWIIVSLLGGSTSGGSIGGGGGSSGSSNSSSKDGYYERDGKKYDIETGERIIKQDGRTYRDGFFGWSADKDFFGNDKVEKDIFGNPKIEKDIFGNQKIEKDFFDDPIVPPKKKR